MNENDAFIPEIYCGDLTILTENLVIDLATFQSPMDLALMTPDEVIDIYRLKFFSPDDMNRMYTDKRFTENTPESYREALLKRVETGEFKAVIRVAVPGGVLCGGPYTDVSEIPNMIPDRFHEYYFPIEDCTIIHGFERVSK